MKPATMPDHLRYNYHRSLALQHYREANGVMMRSTPATRTAAEKDHYNLVELGNQELLKADKYRENPRFPATPIPATTATKKGNQS